ncbi:hypothetical protein [Streptomyces sp. NPDC088789]|uniref:hypothetical protein n=1 Tax=Streptomyces sp. NPDC088789 TaxID=3365899 RepID=UPI00380BA5F2
MPHSSVELEIATEAIEALIPGAAPAHLTVQVTEMLPGGTGPRHTWSGRAGDVAETVLTALYGRRRADDTASPLARAEDAKRRRDLAGEIDALTAGHEQLTSAPWYPLRPGDLVHLHVPAAADFPPFGETYLVSSGAGPHDPAPHLLSMTLLAHTSVAEDQAGMVGCYATEAHDDPLYDAWFEAGPHLLTVVRDGLVVHNGGGR